MAGPLEHGLGRVRPDPVVLASQRDGHDAIERGFAGHDERRAADARQLPLHVERRHHGARRRAISRGENMLREHGADVLRGERHARQPPLGREDLRAHAQRADAEERRQQHRRPHQERRPRVGPP